MQPAELACLEELLNFQPVIEKLCKIAESSLLLAHESGKYQLQHHKVVKGRRSRVWNSDRDALELRFGDSIFGERELLTPAAAEKKLGKDAVKDCIQTIEGGNKLVPRSSILEEVSINCSEFN